MNDVVLTGTEPEQNVSACEQVDVLCSQAWQLHNIDKPRAIALCREAMQMAQSGEFAIRPYLPGLATAQAILGAIKIMDFRLDDAMDVALQVLSMLEGLPTCLAHIYVYLTISWLNFYHSEYPTALENAHECLRMAEELGNREMQSYALDLIGVIHGLLGDVEHALENHARAMQIAEEIAIPDLLMVLYNNLADRLCSMGRLEEARENSEKALSIARENHYQKEAIYCQVTLAEIFMNMEEYALAGEYLQRVLQTMEAGNVMAPWLQAGVLVLTASFYLAQDKYESVGEYLGQAVQVSRSNNFKNQEMTCHQMYVQMFEKTAQAGKALEHLKLAYALQTEITGADKARKAALLKAMQQVEMSRREAEIFRLKNMELEQRVQERTADLQQVNTELESALRSKDEFLAAVSHELRTPLTVILGMTQMLQMDETGKLDETHTQALNNIQRSGMRLNELVNDILAYSRLQGGKPNLRLAEYSLEKVCAEALRKVEHAALKKKQKTSFSSNVKGLVWMTDREVLDNILRHLLGNASKFTPEGGQFGLEIFFPAAKDAVLLTVWDTGIGIQPDDYERIFEPFVQLDARLSRKYEGAGLGLALVRQYLTLLGGGVDVQSVPGEGSRFTLTLPLLMQD